MTKSTQTETPRTDAEEARIRKEGGWGMDTDEALTFARQLETELIASAADVRKYATEVQQLGEVLIGPGCVAPFSEILEAAKSLKQLTAPPSEEQGKIQRITPENQPVFPCWLWDTKSWGGPPVGWMRVEADEFYGADPALRREWSHWHPDQPESPDRHP